MKKIEVQKVLLGDKRKAFNGSQTRTVLQLLILRIMKSIER